MNIKAGKAFLELPNVITYFDTGVIYTFQYGFKEIREEDKIDSWFINFKVDLLHLMDFYVQKGFLTKEDVISLRSQIYSEDRESWYLAFILLDNLKHRLWENKE